MRAILGCGIAYPVAYAVANDGVAASRYPGYSRRDQAISELSAVDAPTRPFLTSTLPVFTGLLAGYGIGVWKAAGGRRPLRATAVVLLADAVAGLAWLLWMAVLAVALLREQQPGGPREQQPGGTHAPPPGRRGQAGPAASQRAAAG